MPERFESYSPEETVLMKSAFDEAWPSIGDRSMLGRKLLASAIIDLVNEGLRNREEIVAMAIATFASARSIGLDRSARRN